MKSSFVILATLLFAAACDADVSSDVLAEVRKLQASVGLLERYVLESTVDDRLRKNFVRASVCASDDAASSLPLGDVPGLPVGVSGQARCALYCQDFSGCIGFNYRSKAAGDGTQCQLYKSAPTGLAAAPDCNYYRATGGLGLSTGVAGERILVQQHFINSPGEATFFNKVWAEYKAGFGDVAGNYWIGNERLHELTKDGRYKLRVDVKYSGNNKWYYAEYAQFIVDDEASQYTLNIGGYSGNTGDSLAEDDAIKFTTSDRDNDPIDSVNCASSARYGNGGGWWYGVNSCGFAFINASPVGGTYGLYWAKQKLLISRMWLLPLL